ncbi:hypothetical protein [Sphingobium sp. EP60837]|uniref:hypothetical protein n=1 Tax=Sphingobium sp. EP60837 TaxID=1855519 RepID=UPI0007DDC00A|nr:hypothetical protein [Sphingobium sp. EP60837]ANI79020.1 hypothetical protein EP837_02625 [Sphingobium sp. EP60837]
MKTGAPETEPVIVSDHALVRYIERVHGYDLTPIREMMLTNAVRTAAQMGCRSVKLGCGARVMLRGHTIITVLAKGMRGDDFV